MECSVGKYANAAKDECLDCRVNTYQDEENQIVCKKCPLGTETTDTGSDSVNDCKGGCYVLLINR